MNIIDAAYNIGHDYPGGAKLLAQRLGINESVFNSKLNPNTKTHHLSMEEAHRMGQLTGRTDILQAMADDMGYVLVKPPETSSEVEVSISIRRNVAEFGRWMDVIDRSLDDSHISQTERKNLQESVLKVLSRAQHLQALLSGLADQPRKRNDH